MVEVARGPLITFHVPEDRELLAIVGEITLRHSHLDRILRMLVKTFTSVTVEEALDATEYQGSAALRERIKKLARHRLGEGKPLIQLQALLTRCKRATEKRNTLVHDIWARDIDGEAMVQSSDQSFKPLPTHEELRNLLQEIRALTSDLNRARLDGFLFEAMQGEKR